MELLKIVKSDKKDKRFKALFKDGKEVNFGSKEGKTFIDNETENKRKAYIKRHSLNPLEKPFLNKKIYADKPSNLAMGILWGKSKNINENIKTYKKKFDI